LAAIAPLCLTACDGGSGGGLAGGGSLGSLGSEILNNQGEFSGSTQSVAAYKDAISSDEAYHLLKRAAFGATPEQVAVAVENGLAATVDDLLDLKPVPRFITELEETYEDDLPKRWLVHLIESPNPLREKMTLFWHDRFATSRRVLDGRDRNLGLLHLNMLREYSLGNYRLFLRQLTLDPLMLIWLDGANSPKESPNENYTREFWELFTLGRDVLYTEDDIREGARSFTGITLLRESERDARPIYDLLHHDETFKSIFPDRASASNFDYISVIDLTLDQPEAAEYVARNLFEYFVHDNPSDEVISRLAATFRDAGYQIEPLVRTILTSQAMFSAAARSSLLASPVEHVVGVARTLDMHIHSEDSQGFQLDRLRNDLRDAGQELMNPPGVEGWGENELWLEDQWVISRISALERTMEYGPDRTAGLPQHLLPARDTWSEREIRDELVNRIADVFHLELTEEEREIYVEVLDQNGWRAFHLEEPDNQPRHVFEMIRLMAMDERVMSK
jgi:hypothetical protein